MLLDVHQPSFWSMIKALSIFESGDQSKRLWSASQTIELYSDVMECKKRNSLPMRAIDFGCGTGRDCIFLALRSWDVAAIDKQATFLQRLQQFADRYSVSNRISKHLLDVKNPTRQENIELKKLLSSPFRLANFSRFFDRSLFLLTASMIPPGGYIVVHHFVEGSLSRVQKPMKRAAARDLIRHE